MGKPVDSNSWGTPLDLYNKLDEEFHFELDACASVDNHKHKNYITIEQDSLTVDWSQYGSVWVNPPYSRGLIRPFMQYVNDMSEEGTCVVTLTRFDPSAKWFQHLVDGKADEVRMLDRRVKFVGQDGEPLAAYNFPCCVSIYNPTKMVYQVPRMVTKYRVWGW